MAGQAATTAITGGIEPVGRFFLAQVTAGTLFSQQAVGGGVGEVCQVIVAGSVRRFTERLSRRRNHADAAVHEAVSDTLYLVSMAVTAGLLCTVHIAWIGDQSVVGGRCIWSTRVTGMTAGAVLCQRRVRSVETLLHVAVAVQAAGVGRQWCNHETS